MVGQSLDRRIVRDVGGFDAAAARLAGSGDLFRDLFEFFAGAADQYDLSAERGEVLGDGGAERSSRAGDDGDFVLERGVHGKVERLKG